jgi:hypothetical protein
MRNGAANGAAWALAERRFIRHAARNRRRHNLFKQCSDLCGWISAFHSFRVEDDAIQTGPLNKRAASRTGRLSTDKSVQGAVRRAALGRISGASDETAAPMN